MRRRSCAASVTQRRSQCASLHRVAERRAAAVGLDQRRRVHIGREPPDGTKQSLLRRGARSGEARRLAVVVHGTCALHAQRLLHQSGRLVRRGRRSRRHSVV